MEVRLHTQYFDKNWKIRKILKIDCILEMDIQSIFLVVIGIRPVADNTAR